VQVPNFTHASSYILKLGRIVIVCYVCVYILNQWPPCFLPCVNRHFSVLAKGTREWSTWSGQELSWNFSCCYTVTQKNCSTTFSGYLPLLLWHSLSCQNSISEGISKKNSISQGIKNSSKRMSLLDNQRKKNRPARERRGIYWKITERYIER
jgi:hypothetical protein